MKYLISPKHSIAHFWANEMNLSKREYIVVNNIEKLHGVKTKNQVIYLEGMVFDYPECANEAYDEKFNNLLDEVEYYIQRLPYE